jgi:hypothetical protein
VSPHVGGTGASRYERGTKFPPRAGTRVLPPHGGGERRGIGDACAQNRFLSLPFQRASGTTCLPVMGKREKATKREESTRGFLQAAPLTPPKFGGLVRWGLSVTRMVWWFYHRSLVAYAPAAGAVVYCEMVRLSRFKFRNLCVV